MKQIFKNFYSKLGGIDDSILLILSISIVFLIVFIVVFLKKRAYQRRLRAELLEKERIEQELMRFELAEAKRLKDKISVERMFRDITLHNRKFLSFTLFKNGYFNNYKLVSWKDSVKIIYNELKKYKIDTLGLEDKIETEITKFQINYETGKTIRRVYNKGFIKRELIECDDFFSNIDSQSLDKQQRLAIVKDEDNNLVIAGAGSGKTTTVAGKVAYVIDRFKIKPEEILLITFTKKAGDEMRERIKKKMNIDISVNTFHSFGRKIIGEVTKDMPSLIEERQFYSEMKNIFKELFKDSIFAGKVIKFITEFRVEVKDDNDFKSHGDYIKHIKDNNIRSYKTTEVSINGRITVLRENCKSLEEVQIANFLFINGIDYKYEDPYKYKTSNNIYAQYRPDFYLTEYDIYIEHFGLIDRNNNVPNWFSSSGGLSAKEKYNSGIKWKRETHSNFDTILVETYSYENKEGVLLENLKEKLEDRGVVFRKRSDKEIWNILNSIAKDEVNSLDTLINTFLNLYKSNNIQIVTLKDHLDTLTDQNRKIRYSLFLDLFIPILTNYNEFLKSKNLIDFSDMINDAAKYISKNKFKNKFKYIIVDEFQDTSVGRFNLINELLKNNRSCKLFAVGDDWQSIFRFAGSDISLFTKFEEYFGFSEISKIETTYRFSKSMIDISSKFILSNPNQSEKKLRAFNNDTLSPIEIINSNSFKNDDPYPFITALSKIHSENLDSNKKIKILALARYTHFVELYKERKDLFLVMYDENEKSYFIKYLELPHIEVQLLTVHRSKGLQADYVILLHCVSGAYGFPSEQADDPILNLLLSSSDQYANGEERRLFYVALTRSKTKTFITTNITYKSKFIDEIDPNFIDDFNNKCPICKEGNKIKQEGIGRNDKPYVKYSCSNWSFGCEYLEWG